MTQPAPTSFPGTGVAPLRERFDEVRRIAVLRGGGLGDVIFALPAMTALVAAYPGAELTLLGTPMHAALFDGRPGPVSRVEVLPHRPGIRPGADEDPAATAAFVERMRALRLDLAVQLHGGGRNSNPFVSSLGARHTIGLGTDDAPRLDRTLPYLYYQHEVLRGLEVAGLAGAAPVDLDPRFPVLDAEREAASHRRTAERLVVIHPGASDVRRHWPAERFGEVARRLVAEGVQVLVVGDGGDVAAAARILALADSPLATSVAGELTLPELVGVCAVADVVLGNDSGPRHLAQAVGTATVGVFTVGNAVQAAAFGRERHRIRLGWMTRCPVCGRDVTQVGWTAERCEHEVSFVADVEVDGVHDDVVALLEPVT